MDLKEKYQKKIIEVLNKYQKQFRKIDPALQYFVLKDVETHHYQFLWTGWQGERHIFNVAFHLHIKDNKIYIQQDKTEDGIANWLLEAGVEKSQIVLAYFSPKHRQFMDFAEA